MRIFLSYASEKYEEAERLALSLQHEGHKVFFDRYSLPKGGAYDKTIRDNLRDSKLLIVLISPEAFQPSSYVLSELELYRSEFPNPSGSVLPVIVAPTEVSSIPNYLKAVNIVKPMGDVVAEVTAIVSDIVDSHRRKKFKRILLAFAITALVVTGVVFLFPFRQSQDPFQAVAQNGFSVFAEPNQDSRIIRQVTKGTEFTLFPNERTETWMKLRLENGLEGWAMGQDMAVVKSTSQKVDVGRSFGYRGTYWQLFFTSPQPADRAHNEYGIDVRFVNAINNCTTSLDIVASSLNSELITDAIIAARKRNVVVRVVTDRKKLSGEYTFHQLERNDIPVSTVAAGNKLVLSQFSILDNKVVWTGSWTYTDMGTFRNNDNALALESPDIAAIYSARFNVLFAGGSNGHDESKTNSSSSLPVKAFFTPENDVAEVVRAALNTAKHSIKFMTQGFDEDSFAEILKAKAQSNVEVKGIIEQRHQRSASGWELVRSEIANLQVRLDGNPNLLHHNCIIIDDKVLLTGSVRFNRAMDRDLADLVLIEDLELAAKYNAEFHRIWNTAMDKRALLNQYLGTYKDDTGSEITVTNAGGKLLLEERGLNVILVPDFESAEGQFKVEGEDTEVTFYKDDDNDERVTSLILSRSNNDPVTAKKIR